MLFFTEFNVVLNLGLYSYKLILSESLLQLVEDLKARKPATIPATWLSEKFLVRCLERKQGGLAKGQVSTYRVEWGREGLQEVLTAQIQNVF